MSAIRESVIYWSGSSNRWSWVILLLGRAVGSWNCGKHRVDNAI
jgi:hypothetical protein